MKRIVSTLGLTFCAIALVSQLAAQTWQVAGPTPRDGHSSVLDTTTNSMLVFGGYVINSNTNDPAGFFVLNDVWRLNGNLTWTALKPTGTPPVARAGNSAFYDAASNRMVIFGGGEGAVSPCANDVWALTNANGRTGTPSWVQITPSGTVPSPRDGMGSAYDPNTNSMMIYGGGNCFALFYDEVWVLSNANGLGGTPAWTQLFPAGGDPGARVNFGQALAYDSANNRLIVFGGYSIGAGPFNDVWVLTNANGQGGTPTWTQLAPSGTLPAARSSHSNVYDAKNNRLIIFGGIDSSGNILQDVWVLTNANGLGGTPVWTQLGPFHLLPEGRSGHSGVYNPKTKKMTIFGGTTALLNSGSTGINTNDVWVLSHANGK